MKTLHFTVEGGYITQLARERYRETKDLSVGVDFLTKAIIGFPKDLATAVVLGNKKLVGTDEVVVEDDSVAVEPYGFIKPSDIKDIVCGWIAPDGEVYGHKFYNETNDHHILAELICEKFSINTPNEEFALEDRGWIKFSPARVIAGRIKVTEGQKLTVTNYCIEHGKKVQLGWSERLYSGSEICAMDLIMFNKNLGCR